MTDDAPDAHSPSLPDNGTEDRRLALLHRLELLDTPDSDAFDRLVRLASNLLQTPIALVSLIDERRQWFKAKLGVDIRETPRAHAFCAHAIQQDGMMEVPDAASDERFAHNPLVTGPPGIRFYAGMPLTMPGGEKLGTLCVIDTKPRQLSVSEREILTDLAALVCDEIALHQTGRDALAELRYRQKLEQELRIANLTKTDFMARLGHELRTPLNAIIGFSDLIISSGREPAIRDHASDILRAGEHLLTLVNRFLDFSKAEADRIDLMLEEVNLAQVLEESLRLTRTLAEQRGIAMPPPQQRNGPAVRGDSTRLRQVMLNILTNAVKFTPRGGSVTVSLGNNPQYAWVTVRDTGVGIRPEDMPLVLAPFGQAHRNHPDTHKEGTGLGLPIARSLVERHGGSLTLDSTPGCGTSVTIRLPVAGPPLRPGN